MSALASSSKPPACGGASCAARRAAAGAPAAARAAPRVARRGRPVARAADDLAGMDPAMAEQLKKAMADPAMQQRMKVGGGARWGGTPLLVPGTAPGARVRALGDRRVPPPSCAARPGDGGGHEEA
jgi:hypothetical protein